MTNMSVSSFQNINWSGMSNFTQFIQNANQSGGNFLFASIDILVFLVLLITLSGTFGWEAGMLSAGFIALILTLLFAYMGVVAWTFTGYFIGAIVIMIAYIVWSSSRT